MLALILNTGFLWSSWASFVAPGMTYAEVAALVRERPIILNRTSENAIRGAQYPKARLVVTFEEGRVSTVQRN
jgi:hypothetical protein